MKTTLTLITTLLFIGVCSRENSVSNTVSISQPAKTDTLRIIKDIKAQFSAINSGSNLYRKKERAVSGLSAEGGTVTSYYNKTVLVKEHVVLYGETGKVEMDLYFNQGGLFFEYKAETIYDKPIYIKGYKIKGVQENRYYFYKGELIRWLGPGNKIMNPFSDKFKDENKALKESLKQIKES